jgi:hypothetical protein
MGNVMQRPDGVYSALVQSDTHAIHIHWTPDEERLQATEAHRIEFVRLLLEQAARSLDDAGREHQPAAANGFGWNEPQPMNAQQRQALMDQWAAAPRPLAARRPDDVGGDVVEVDFS